MIKGKTKSGFEFTISERALDNYELLETVAEAQENPLIVPKILGMLLSDDKKRLIEHVREDDGIVPAEKMMEELADIFDAAPDSKN